MTSRPPNPTHEENNMESIEHPTIEARINNMGMTTTCAICGGGDRETVPVGTYLTGGGYDGWVCAPCVAHSDPDLAAALDWFWREVSFAVDANEGSAVYEALELVFDHDSPDGIPAEIVRRFAATIARLRGVSA